ncbi:hypothetical protein [Stappia indica]|uniref:S9 family peptidase n=1 Tax=Stappia indica TaxID=538381 RepID=A0A857C360_9HYPH|nr:hypothetical protein [Stappia indica]QGZ33397.1 hypothetical protein GH266_02105 [Stappia indica]
MTAPLAPRLAPRLAFAIAGLAALLLVLPALPVRADPVSDIVAALPAELQGLTRLPGPDGSGTAFVVAREAARDRLFVLREGKAPVEVSEAGEQAARVTGLRSEADPHGVVAFVDMGETTYELFLENGDAAGYLFQPASN